MPTRTNRRRTTSSARRKSTRSRSTTRRARRQIKVSASVMREIYAVSYIALTILTVLSINGRLGIVGQFWNNFLTPIFGWGLYAVPVLLGGVGLALLFSRKVAFGPARTIGLMLMVVSGLGMIHLSVPEDQLYEIAKAGEAGGYIGFVASFIGRQILGVTGSYVVFGALFLISILLTFSVSLRDVFEVFEWKWEVKEEPKSRKKPKKEEEEEGMLAKFAEMFGGDEAPAMEPEQMTIHTVQAELNRPPQPSPAKPPASVANDDKEEDVENPGDLIPVERIAEELERAEAETESMTLNWEFPPYDLLNDELVNLELNEKMLVKKAESIRNKLSQFGVDVTMKDVHVGPTVIQYTLKPHEGVKLSKITSLKNDLALALAAEAIRIEAPIPGKSLVGIEVPNDTRSMVYLRQLLEADQFRKAQSKERASLLLPFGRDVSGKPVVEDLVKMPHLLVAGATGSGKSVATNSILISLLYQNSPKHLKLILVDPKQVELSSYNGIPHLLTPVITDPEKAAIALRWVVAEMNRRYTVCADAGHRSIDDYNSDKNAPQPMPKIVVVIDELADLMMAAGKEVEASICRIAQMARAVGIHLILATQRPSVDVITGLIKANIPARVAFTVASSIDSRTILDSIGAEDLLGRGDMLYVSGTMGKPSRVQGVFVSSEEIRKVTNRVKLTLEGDAPHYDESITSRKTAGIKVPGVPDPSSGDGSGDDDDLYAQAVDLVRRSQKASATMIQRHLKLGYSRAARILDQLEENGVVGPSRGSKPREVFVQPEEA